jgi:hypothetical protein
LRLQEQRKEPDMQPTPAHPSSGQNPIADRAYQLWETEGKPEGQDLDHWFRAEREILGDAPGNPAAEISRLDDEDSEASPNAAPA